MLSLIFAALIHLATPEEAEALMRTAPLNLTVETAREHLGYARYAGMIYHVDPDELLAWAYFESNYDGHARTLEPGGKVSCGVLTPIPKQTCNETSLLHGYLEGAQHIAGWMHGARHGEVWNKHIAMLGVAGGYVLIDACAKGPVWKERKNGAVVDLCTTPEVRQYRTNWIKSERRLISKV